MPDLLYYSHEDMLTDLRSMVRDMAKRNFRPDYIFGVARGGLVPATFLSHYFEVPLVTATVSLRDTKVIDGLEEIAALLQTGKQILMVDDICDSGETLQLIWSKLNDLLPEPEDDEKSPLDDMPTLVLWHNPAQDHFNPDYIGREIDRSEDDSWIVFPWETWWKV
jgi:xanthine phosphoribosyltransferase